MLKDAFGLIFTGENNPRLKDLIDKRTIAAIPFAGRYRIIDFMLSNLVNSGVSNVGLITQFNYHSLMDHVGTGKEWDLNRKIDGLFLLPPYYQSGQSANYRGRVDALKAVMQYINRAPQQYCIFSGSHIAYSMAFDEAFDFHMKTGADVTIIYNDTEKGMVYDDVFEDLRLEVDETGRVTDMQFNPGFTQSSRASMDAYIMDKQLLIRLVDECISRNRFAFISDLLLPRVKSLKIYGYEFDGYVARIDSVLAYFKHNLDILNPFVSRALFESGGPVFTKVRDEVPAKYGPNAKVKNCMLADGCIVEGSVEDSVLFRGVHVRPGASVKNSIVMQDSEITEGASVTNVILDKEVLIRRGRTLCGSDDYPVVVKKGAVV